MYLASSFFVDLFFIKVFSGLIIKSQGSDSVLPLHFCSVSIPDTLHKYRGRG